MRIRSTKPEFWRSGRIASVDWDARLVLKGLESYVDDNGVGKDDVALIVGDVFPRDMLASPRETVARVSEAISRLNQAGLVWRYEADSTRLLYISWWEDIQRIDKPGKGRFPRPDGTMDYKSSTIRESVANPRESVAPGTGEQGNRGTGEPPYPPAEFEPSPEQPRTRRTGSEIARSKFSVVPTSGSQLAGQIVRSYGDYIGTPVDAKTSKEMTAVIDAGLQAGQSPDAIAAGIQLWAQSDSWSPSQIPKFITKAAATRRHNGVGKPTQQAVVTQNLAAEIIAEMDQP